MKIFAICLTRNEADVIAACLTEARTWCDRIFVYDGASEDGTWQIVQRMVDDKIVAWRSERHVFREGLRADVFAAFRHEARPGDWWCQLNADEFYVENPRDFLAAVPPRDHVVWAVNLQYYLTPTDLEAGAFTGDFARDRSRLRYYEAPVSERRFFRHRKGLVWNPQHAWPAKLGVVHRRLLHFQHYPYRSPQQIQMRLDVRRAHRAGGFEGWDHAKEAGWREKLVPASRLQRDAGDGSWVVPEAVRKIHVESLPRRALKRALGWLGYYR